MLDVLRSPPETSIIVPILTINNGHLGILARAYFADLDQVLDLIVARDWTIEECSMLGVCCQ
jgi:NAD kinase